MLQSCDWSRLHTMHVNDAYASFKSAISEAVEKCSKTRRTRHKNIYMNRHAMQLRKKKETLWGVYRKTLDPLDHARFTRCRNELRSLTRKLRKDYECVLAGRLKQNPKAFRRYASSRLRAKSRVEDLLDDHDVLTSTNQEKAEVLSSFYDSIFTQEGNEPPPTMDSS